MTRGAIREYVEAVRPRYLAASKKVKKSEILAEFCQTTGYHRDTAIRLLGHPPGARSGARRGRPRRYGTEVREDLKAVWEAADRICSKRLQPFVPTLLESLERHGEVNLCPPVRSKLVAMSAATMDRLLKPYRVAGLRRPFSQSRAVSGIQALVPVRTFGEWEGVAPGSLQMDLVSHCGESTEGFYLTTLMAVDVALGWTDCRAVWGKGKDRVGGAAYYTRQALPFPLREIHTDNGGEFLNDALYPWCQRHGIRFTRGRPYKKNDQAYVEQKNWTVVRRVVGYDRFASKAAFQALERVYRPLRLYINFFQPLRKLVGKVRDGSKVVKRYDEAKTPYQRLMGAGVLDPDKQAELERLFRSLNPVQLRAEIDAALDELWKLAERPAGANGVGKQAVACA